MQTWKFLVTAASASRRGSPLLPSCWRAVSLVVLFWDFSTEIITNSPFLRFDVIV